MRKALLLIGIIGTAVFLSHFGVSYGRAMWGSRDMWWTPRSLALPLDDSRDEFRVFVLGEPLSDHVERGSLTVIDEGGEPHVIGPADVRVRLNNWDATRASLLHSAVYAAFMLGASATCLALGLAQFLRQPQHAAADEQSPPANA
jgi:hypothetical protein